MSKEIEDKLAKIPVINILVIFGKKIKNLVKPEFLLPDYMIGISNRFYGAIRKTRDDFISDGATMKSRNWDHYEEF